MAEKIEFPTWTFEPDLHEAWHRETGEAVQFTRAERALLNAFIESSGHVLQRDLLLDAVAGLDAEVADRSIDFIIHRLRRKLRDKPRDPHYIATQYGEGYVWVAETMSTQHPAAGAFMVVGPVRGLDFAAQLADRGRLFARALAREIDHGTADHNRVVFDGSCPPPADFTGRPPQFALTPDFLETADGRLDCVLTLRRFQLDSIIRIERVTVCDAHSAAADERRVVARLARDLADAIWHASQTYSEKATAPEAELLAVSLHEASEQLTGRQETWKDAGQRLRRTLHNRPDDAQAQLMLAATLHSRYVLTPPSEPIATATRRRDETEIEQLVQTALPHLQNNGIFVLTAAKLLYFVNKAHRQLALDLAEDAFASTTAFANAFAVVGQLRMWEGDLDGAMKLYDQGQEFTRYGGHFHRYLLVLKMHAELAQGCEYSPAADTLFSIVPAERGTLGLLWAPIMTDAIRTDVDALLDGLNTTAATAIIRNQHYLSARHFHYHAHRQNMMRRSAGLLLERFDADIIPTDIRPDVPPELLG